MTRCPRLLTIRLVLPLLTALDSFAGATGAKPIPAEDFFRPPFLAEAQLSPDGKNLAGLTAEEDESGHLLFLNLENRKITLLRGNNPFRIESVEWLTDTHAVYATGRKQVYANLLYITDLTKPDRGYPLSSSNAQIVGTPRSRPGSLLLWRRELNDEVDATGVVELNAASILDRRMISKSAIRKYPEPWEGIFTGYQSDAVGELAIGYAYRNHRLEALFFDQVTTEWKPLGIDPEATDILLVEPDRNHLWINEQIDGGFVVRRMNLSTGDKEPPVAADRDYDPGSGRIYFSHKEGKLAGLSYSQVRRRHVWLLPRFAEIQAAIDEQLPQTDNVLVNFDRNEQRFLFFSYSDRQPGAYYVLDVAQGKLTPTGQARPWLKSAALRPKQPLSFTTRDGLRLEGYLTLPEGTDARNKAPLIMLCHGGPWSRDLWAFDEEVQFLANRGYAVFQPNYRGSSGYSPGISLRDRYDFRRMHDDVTDATKAMQRLPMIDADRVAIMGASFGGYLTMAGMAFEPGLYRCGITNAGVFDWDSLIRDKRSDGVAGQYQRLVDHLGKPGQKKEEFSKISPLDAADAITAPVFVAHSITDNVVDESQSRKLTAKLKRQAIPHEYFFRDEEGHGFTSFKTRVEYYRAAEKFLARHLGAASGRKP